MEDKETRESLIMRKTKEHKTNLDPKPLPKKTADGSPWMQMSQWRREWRSRSIFTGSKIRFFSALVASEMLCSIQRFYSSSQVYANKPVESKQHESN